MTIACCFVVPEGIVLGADSTITTVIDGKPHYLNHNQKIFEVGENSQYGMITWGLTAFGDLSYRTLIARLADNFISEEPQSVLDAANIWSKTVWNAYKKAFETEINKFGRLYNDIAARHQPVPKEEQELDKTQRDELNQMNHVLSAGFCIAGYSERDRIPHAYSIEIDPSLRSQPTAVKIQKLQHFGNDEVVSRIIGVFSDEIISAIKESGYWTGDQKDIEQVLATLKLERPDMTMRDAIDFVHFTIYSTIKATKFSVRDKDCGGPIELAVITTDRKFRWVNHKTWDSAISD